MPSINYINKELIKIYKSRHITDSGRYHDLLTKKLQNYLRVDNLTLFNNGTAALISALKVLNLKGEIIVPSFTFIATISAIIHFGLKPIFCDISRNTLTLDCQKISKLINSKTCAILGVHVYGIPCDVENIDKIAKKNNLRVIYDAAHAFGVEINNIPIAKYGDLVMFSFHATKLFNTIEGGGNYL